MDTAIVGMAFRFPGATQGETFWENLIGRRSSVTEIPAHRWDWRQYWGDPKLSVNKTFAKWGGFVDDADAFDHEFFGFLPKVVQTMDPQQRIMLELAWNCLEDAGVAPSGLRGRNVAVVVGVFNHDYKELQERDEIAIEAHHSTGTATAVIANRVSHFFDFRGPSVPVDTACSGSLNAIHNAIQALQFDGCELALAGGINLMLTPTRHISFSKMGMLSPTGTCKTFDDSADGYVRGEGAAFLLLKPLDRAIADGDAIHGVIKGSAVNHCGSTYTLTYPSPQAQSDVIVAAHERAGVPVDTLGFVELHGTGTPKGDPIEFEGLVRAFGTLAQRQGIELGEAFCGLSSVKTNIGHLEAAAGVAGVIKVLLGMQHRVLPPFQNFNRLNSRIEMAGTPFYTLGESRPWLPTAPGVPLRAGVSSFGFGGTNAHVILEEPPPAPAAPARRAPRDEPVLVVLSARTPAGLRERISALSNWLQRAPEFRLADLSRTLLVGREALSSRFACVVDSVAGLRDALAAELDRAAQPTAAASLADEELEALAALVSTWSKLKKAARAQALDRCAAAFRGGASLDWRGLFADRPTPMLRLPGYPFARERFWIPAPLATAVDAQGPVAALHPLLHTNVSTLAQPRFQSTFSGREFFLADHVIDTRCVLPGVAYLEMVRAAARQAWGQPEATAIRVSDAVWQRPLEVGDAPVAVVVELEAESPAGDRSPGQAPLRFRVVEAGDAQVPQVFCRGRVALDQDDADRLLDLGALSADCAGVRLEAGACYEALAALGLQYGPGHRAIIDVGMGNGQCLARIAMPEEQQQGHDAYVVHPSTADAALQAAVALVAGIGRDDAGRTDAPCLPFALDSLQIRPRPVADAAGADASTLFAWARFAPGASGQDAVPKVDIDLIDRVPGGNVGRVRLAFRGLSIRPRVLDVAASPRDSAPHIAPPAGLADALYAPLWITAPVASAAEAPESVVLIGRQPDVARLEASLRASPRFARTRLESLPLATGGDDATHHLQPASLAHAESVVAAWKARGLVPEHFVWVAPQATDTPAHARLDAGARTVFALVKALLRGKRARFVHLLLPPDPGSEALEAAQEDTLGLGAFYKTLAIEKPSFSGAVLQCSVDTSDLATMLADELLAGDRATDVRHGERGREVRKFAAVGSRALPAGKGGQEVGFREGGAYLITGGMGALGLIIARHLCARYRATVYLTGRSAASQAQRPVLDELEALGGRAAYLACDVADGDDVRRVLADIRSELAGRGQVLHGVLHSAGVIEDNFLLRKPEESFARVIAPKTLGTWHLDEATRDDPLDLFVLFSSVTGVLGNVGQCDYAFGNAFEDAFAARREVLRQDGRRQGKSVSINWPYWKDGGMRLGAKEEEALRRSFGIVPLLTGQGIEVLEYAVRQPQCQVVVMPGDADKVHEVLGVVAQAAAPSAPAAGASAEPVHANLEAGNDDPAAWQGPVSRHLAQLFASQLQISADFDHDRSFKEYGFDSVVMIDLIAELEKQFGTLPKTLFFEHQTLGEMTAYFVEHHVERCRAIARPGSASQLPVVPASLSASGAIEPPVQRPSTYLVSSSPRTARVAEAAPAYGDDIAIIGLAGRYPQAPTLEAFWDNLRLGRDCVEEIPADRPDIAEAFRFQPGEAARAKSYSRWGGFLRDVDRFDPLFFNISPKEAENIDPNERLFLEAAAQVIEDAGYTPDTLAPGRGHRENPVGVYVGLMWGDYQLHGVDRPRDNWVVPHSFYWAVANRVSYQFNFAGPSLTIDTACSSSLTAIHLACQAIRQGEIDVAIAGAVNLSLHPNKYNLLSDMHFLSSDGRCRAFGEGGDGYVPGEGVGAVLLKPLSRARQDGDHVYAVIRGSAINHGGKASGFTVPNPKRQAALVRDALDSAGVDPRHISYVEAHGTGTSLGDPIEIAGLTRAFAQAGTQYCAIGSAKSNLGHLEAAAGIAGLTKVLLQMQHRSLVPSIHSDVPNPYIDFTQSPFTVQRTLQPWSRPVVERDGARVELPRLAGISSFGAGGSNGHLIVEEFVDDLRGGMQAQGPVLVVLSARRDAALREMAAGLARKFASDPAIDLADAAYTLQVGRVAHEFRAGWLVGSSRELIEALEAYARHGSLVGRAWSGHRDAAKRDAATADRITAWPARVPEWLANRDLAALGQAWVDGIAVDWAALHPAGSRRRVSLPGYAFQRQRYWIDTSGAVAEGKRAALHPLIDANVSTLDEQAFAKTFQPDAFYLRDHRLGDNRVLPGVVTLELALQAARLAAPGREVVAIEDVRWHKPLIVNQDEHDVRLTLLPERDGIAFALLDGDDDEGQRPYADGAVVIDAARDASAPPATLDLAPILARTTVLDAAAVEAAFSGLGFVFGDSFRVFEALHHNADEALALLRLRPVSGISPDAFVLHPAMLDGAIRASLGVGGFAGDAGIKVPVRLRRIEVHRPLTAQVWVHATRTPQARGESLPGQSHFDLTLCDEHGQVLVRIEQLTIQSAPQLARLARAAAPTRAAAATALPAPSVQSPPLDPRPVDAPAAQAAASLEDVALASLVDLLAQVTKLDRHQIDPLSPLENYGIDSVMIATLNRELEARFGSLPKTLFFEYQELAGIAGYLAEQHPQVLRAMAPAQVSAPRAPSPSPVPAAAVPVPVATLDVGAARAAVETFLRTAVGETVGLPMSDVDAGAPLENYGIDSVMIVKLTGRLEATFGAVSKTLFFEFQDIAGLAEHLAESFPEAASRLIAGSGPTAAPPTAAGLETPVATDAQSIAQHMHAHMRQLLGATAAECTLDTPLAQWPLDPVNVAGLVHSLARDLDGVDGTGPYRHATLREWASRLQWKPAREPATVPAHEAIAAPAPRGEAQAPARKPTRGFRRLAGAQGHEPGDIAIIGLAGRYPGANDLDTFWRNLQAGQDSVTEIPLSRWDHARLFHPDRTVKGAVYSKWGGFIDGVDQFDAKFFNVSAREAELTDPQERLFLQTAWECVEDACYTRASLKGQSVGVFVGVMWGYYAQIDVTDEQLKSGRPNPPFSSIANRVSYFMNFNGPSLAVDTMCSSSLTAIHLSCRAIANGDCDMAIAGGVNVIVHPNKYQKLSAAQFLSSDGRCRAFGADGDGYVPGEGVGAVLLKRLDQALADGDHIHGVIKATSLNHGGKTNGYTVPNQVAQTNVIGTALARSGWHPASIDYIEAHGTGTSLGDPIEIAGLGRAFTAAAVERDGPRAALVPQRCRIGSVKSNVGHLESAAAIAGLTKILLQFRHGTIAPSLHSATLNPNIDFASTPFRVVQQAEAWTPPDERTPRRAGLSSFGAGGANAHCLVEDAPRSAPRRATGQHPTLFVLSADGEPRLQAYVNRVIAFLERPENADVDLACLAYSSQVGREAMDERLAVVSSSAAELLGALRAHRDGDAPANLFRGSPRRQGERLEAIVGEAERDGLIANLITGGRLPQLARAWVSLVDVDWARHARSLFTAAAGAAAPQRIAFPTMPFLTQRYWVEEKHAGPASGALHPLIDANLSTLSQQVYRKRFDGQEFYLRDHIVHTDRDRKILPGVAYLEMARAAGDLAAGDDWRTGAIRNLVWRQPFEILEAPDSLSVRMETEDAALRFVIGRDEGAPCVEGELVLAEANAIVDDEWLDIPALIARGSLLEPRHEDIYAGFRRMGFHFGPSFQVTQARYRLAEGALCRLELPEHLRAGLDQFGVHPCLLDAALRAGLAVNVAGNDEPVVPIVPFALDEIEFFHPLTQTCYAHVVRSHDALAAGGTARSASSVLATAYKYDIVVTDEQGRVLVKLHGFSGRPLVRQGATERVLQYFDDAWVPAPLAPVGADARAPQTVLLVADDRAGVEAFKRALAHEDRCVDVAFVRPGETSGGLDPFDASSVAVLFARLQQEDRFPDRIVVWNTPDGAALSAGQVDAHRLHRGVQAVRQLFTACERVRPGAPVRMLYVHPGAPDAQPEHEAIIGYARSLLTVNHRFELTTLRDDRPDAGDVAAAIVAELDADSAGQEVANRGAVRHRRTLRPLTDLDGSQALPLRDGGTYLVTGGAGKLGLVVARWLAGQARVRLLLTGRSRTPSASVQASLDALRALGAQVEYHSVDTLDEQALVALVDSARTRWGGLNGVIHCAGVASDRSILELDDAAFAEVLTPKVDGLVLLDRATAAEPLDFFVMFSSVSALIGDLGSGAYAAGNRFMDAYASWRESLRAQGLRQGRSMAIGWPLWATGGMEITGGDALVFGYSGLQALTEAEGVSALDALLRAPRARVLVTVGDPRKIARTLRLPAPAVDEPAPGPLAASHQAPATPPADAATRVAPMIHVAPQVRAPKISVAPTVRVEPRGAEPAANNAADTSGLRAQVGQWIVQCVAKVTKTPAVNIDARATFEQCGMDSVQLLELHTALRVAFDALPKTALFEFDSADRLADHLLRHYADAVRTRFADEPVNPVSAAANPVHDSAPPAASSGTPRARAALPLPALPTKRMPAAAGARGVTAAEGIAIIGMAGEFPAAPDLATFWRNLREGRDCLVRVPDDRGFGALLNQHRWRSGKPIADKGGFIADIDLFDTGLFRMSQAEADKADPQLRVLLRAAWRAVEDAAYTPEALSASRVGVFVGAMNEDFTRVAADLQQSTEDYLGPGSVGSELSNRLSFLMNLRGPSLTVATACSASMTALHLARRAILAGDCDAALVAGINLSLHQGKYHLLHDMKVLSPDGEERTFDDAANGLVPSEGVGVVLLKPLGRATADGDHVHGVLRASRISHSGTGAGQFMPNLRVMEETAADCVADAGLVADDIAYIESHGTGTELGDPIELKALDNALRRTSDAIGFCAVGSKAAIGHMEAASGIGSLIKVLLGMRHGELAPCAKLQRVNGSFDHAGSALRFHDTVQPWPSNARGTRIAGINSFGMGGSNAFVVVESPAPMAPRPGHAAPALVLLSARSPAGLRDYAASLLDFLRAPGTAGQGPAALADLAYSSQVGRVAWRHRLAVVAASTAELITLLEAIQAGSTGEGVFMGDAQAQASLDVLRLLQGDPGQGFVETLLRSQDLARLGDLWVRGATIDWPALHHGQGRHRVPFPGAPFESVRCSLHHLVAEGGRRAPARERIVATAQVFAPAQAASDDAAPGSWFRLADVAPGSFDLAGAETSAEAPHDEQLRAYWVGHLGDPADTAIDLRGSLPLESAAADPGSTGTVHVVSEVVDLALVRTLQAFGTRHGIALETLVSAAWAVLINRHTKARHSQFGLLGADGRTAPVLLPVRVRTVGRQKMLEWLADLQAALLRKHHHALAPVQTIGHWVGSDRLFDCVVAFDPVVDAAGGDVARRLASEIHLSEGLPLMELVAATAPDSLELSLIYRAVAPDNAGAATVLEQVKVLLEGIVSNPDRLPSALGMRTRAESRDGFWKTMEATTEGS